MTQQPPRVYRERLTVLELKGPNNLTPEQQAWPEVPLADEPQRLTVLEPKQPNEPTKQPADSNSPTS
jgi:hypothetical protein